MNDPLLLGNRSISKKIWENVNIFVLGIFNDFCVISVCGLMEKSYYSVVFISVFGRWHKNQSCGFIFTHSVFPFVKLIVNINSILGIKLKKKIKNLAPVWTPVPNWVLESGGQLSRLTRTTLEWWLTKIYINKPSQQMVLCGGHVNCLINNLADSLWCFGRHKRTL